MKRHPVTLRIFKYSHKTIFTALTAYILYTLLIIKNSMLTPESKPLLLPEEPLDAIPSSVKGGLALHDHRF